MHHKIGVLHSYQFRALLCRLGMHAVLAIVSQINQLVLPFARLVVLYICNQLIHRRTGLFEVHNRQTSHADIHLGFLVRCSFVIVQPTEIVVRSVSIHFIDGVLRLIGQQ